MSQGPGGRIRLGSPAPARVGPAARPRARQASALPPAEGFPLRGCLSCLLPGPTLRAVFHWNKSEKKSR